MKELMGEITKEVYDEKMVKLKEIEKKIDGMVTNYDYKKEKHLENGYELNSKEEL